MGILLPEIEILVILSTENGQYSPCEAKQLAENKSTNGWVDRLGSCDFPRTIVLYGPCTKQKMDESVAKGHRREGPVIS